MTRKSAPPGEYCEEQGLQRRFENIEQGNGGETHDDNFTPPHGTLIDDEIQGKEVENPHDDEGNNNDRGY
jgi:hypothetical protein